MRGTGLDDSLNLSPYAFGILDDFVRPESHDLPTFLLHHGRTTCVRFDAKGMMIAVYLDDEPARYAGEIRKVRADRMLSAELHAVNSSRTYELPDLVFGAAAVASEFTCSIGIVVVAGHYPLT